MNIFILISLLLTGTACGAPNHLKHVEIEKQVAAGGGVPINNLGASASWGPFSAGAGLGDNGIASAGAHAGSVGASAGVGGASTASASATAGTGVGNAPPTGTVFDQIFNIPISVLKTVNEHLNTRDAVPGTYRRLRKCRRRGVCSDDEGVVMSHSVANAGAQAGTQVNNDAAIYSRSAGTASADANASAQTGGGAPDSHFRVNVRQPTSEWEKIMEDNVNEVGLDVRLKNNVANTLKAGLSDLDDYIMKY